MSTLPLSFQDYKNLQVETPLVLYTEGQENVHEKIYGTKGKTEIKENQTRIERIITININNQPFVVIQEGGNAKVFYNSTSYFIRLKTHSDTTTNSDDMEERGISMSNLPLFRKGGHRSRKRRRRRRVRSSRRKKIAII